MKGEAIDLAVYAQAMVNVYKGGNAPERGITAKEHQQLIDAEYKRLRIKNS